MGIRGAWSTISSDPRRYGEPWVCTKDAIIWIDGPSLVYHVALQPRFEEMERFYHHYNQLGQASPASIHKRTSHFVSVLSSIAKEVHIVMDGLCSLDKLPTQLHRMTVAAQNAEMAARSTSVLKNCKVISILGTWSLIDAVQKIRGEVDNLHLHRPSHGEAEAYIDSMMGGYQDKSGVVVMSNDTDYLIYENSPGLLPFSTLQFKPSTEISSCMTLTGFHYLSFKFRNSISFVVKGNQLMSTIAGMAGCDYDDEILQAGRSFIVKSRIGGLQKKQQNNPTAADTLRAVIRYIIHFAKPEGSWQDAFAQSIGIAGLLRALGRVHETYFAGIPVNEEPLLISLESHRLITQSMLLCRPFIEKSCSSGSSTPKAPPKVRQGKNLSKRSRKRRKRKDAAMETAEPKRESESDQLQSLELKETISQLSYEDVMALLDNQSVWTLANFKQIRAIIYNLEKQKTTTLGGSDDSCITELRACGHGESLYYKEFRLLAQVHSAQEGLNAPSCDVMSAAPEIHPISLAASMLPPKLKWLWMLLVTAPEAVNYNEAAVTILDFNIANLLSAAYFHACLMTEVGHRQVISGQCLNKMDFELAAWIWTCIRGMNADEMPGSFFQARSLSLDVRDDWHKALESLS